MYFWMMKSLKKNKVLLVRRFLLLLRIRQRLDSDATLWVEISIGSRHRTARRMSCWARAVRRCRAVAWADRVHRLGPLVESQSAWDLRARQPSQNISQIKSQTSNHESLNFFNSFFFFCFDPYQTRGQEATDRSRRVGNSLGKLTTEQKPA